MRADRSIFMTRSSTSSGLVRGGVAGLLATVPMTMVILGARKVSLLRTPPPVEISERVIAKLPDSVETAAQFRPLWLVAHGGYGMLCGVIYRLLRGWLPQDSRAAGLLFGGAVWGVSYLGVMPALSLYPWPDKDAKPRLAVMVAAHAFFGVTLAGAVEQLDAR